MPPGSFKGLWGQDYETRWAPMFESVFVAAQAVSVDVLLWGPGESSSHYAKRTQIGESLADGSTNVATPEALFAADPRFGEFGDTLLAEGIQAEAADIVLALAVRDHDVTGVHAELTRYGDHERIGPKIHLFAPFHPHGPNRALILEAAEHVPDSRRFDYTDPQYGDCTQIRAKARQWVEAARRQKYLAGIRSGAIRPR